MDRRLLIIVIAAVMITCAVPLALSPAEETDAAVSPNTTVRAYNGDGNAYVSDTAIVYDGSVLSGYHYFPNDKDPTANLPKVMTGEMTLSDLDEVTPTAGNPYYVLRSSSSAVSGYHAVDVDKNLVFLEKGSYTINVVSSTFTNLSINFQSDTGGSSTNITLTGGAGTTENFYVDIPGAYYFSYYDSSYPWYENTLTYTIDPAPVKKTASEYPGSATVLSDRQWMKAVTGNDFSNTLYLKTGQVAFVDGSTEETEFLENVVSKNLTDASAYHEDSVVASSQKMAIYQCLPDNSQYIYVSVGSLYDSTSFSVTEKLSNGTAENNRFMTTSEFSIAVQFDTSRIQYVKLTDSSGYSSNSIALESGRLYKVMGYSSQKYTMSAVLKVDAASVGPVSISMYTEGVYDDASGEGKTVHPYNNWNCRTWVSDGPVQYEGSMYSNQEYFNSDPTDDVMKVIACEMSFDDLPSVSPSYGNSYWILGFGDNSYSGADYDWHYLVTEPDIFYLEKGEWTINVTRTNCDYLSLYPASSLVGDGRYDSIDIDLSDGRGSVVLDLSRPDAYYFSSGSSGGTCWLDYTVSYTIDPVPEQKTVTEFPEKGTVLTNYHWVRLSPDTYLTGRINLEYSSYLMFAKGSAEETSFLENVVSKNLTDASAYKKNYLILGDSGQQIVAYQLAEVSRGIPDYLYINIDPDGGSSWQSMYLDVSSEEISPGDASNSRFYAGKRFSIAVKYDTDRVQFVAIGFTNLAGNVEYAPLQSGRLYEFEMDSAAEYQMYAILKDGETDMSPLEVEMYTSGLAEKDDYGMVFAAAAIGLCVLAFGILFISGRRPKWSDDTGTGGNSGKSKPKKRSGKKDEEQVSEEE